MRKILLSLLTVSAVAVIAFVVTTAYFSDTETSTGNVFEAGSIDLQIDNTSYYNGATSSATTWAMKDLEGELFFDFHDLKPGDEGEDTISLHVYDNDAWACVDIDITANDDVTCTEPELDDDVDCEEPGEGLGELAQELNFIFWADDGDNVLEDGESVLTEGPAALVLDGVTWTLADSNQNNVGGAPGEPLTGSVTYYIGKAWCFGELTPDPVPADQGINPTVDPGIDCDGSLVDNASQTDKLMADITFTAIQSRHNLDFECFEGGIGCLEKADVMLVLDRSGSIDSGELSTLQAAAKAFVDALSPSADGVHVGMVSFADTASLNVHLTDNGGSVKTAIDGLSSGGNTNLSAAIGAADGELDNPGDTDDRDDGGSPDFMVIITDGSPNEGGGEAGAKTAADAAKLDGIKIFAVGVGTTPATATFLKDDIVSPPAGDHYFDAGDFGDLEAILADIATCPGP